MRRARELAYTDGRPRRAHRESQLRRDASCSSYASERTSPPCATRSSNSCVRPRREAGRSGLTEDIDCWPCARRQRGPTPEGRAAAGDSTRLSGGGR